VYPVAEIRVASEDQMTDEQTPRYVIRHLPGEDQPPQDRSRAAEREWADQRFTEALRQLRAVQATGELVLVDRRHVRTVGERELRREAIQETYRQATTW
jgi:aminoglycoside phosphotransferase (APT) family kinase protein